MSERDSVEELNELKKQLRPLLDVNPEAYDVILEKYRKKNLELIGQKEAETLLIQKMDNHLSKLDRLRSTFYACENKRAKDKDEIKTFQKFLNAVTENVKTTKEDDKKLVSELDETRLELTKLKEQLRKVWEDKLNLVKENEKMKDVLKEIVKNENKLVIERNKKFDALAGKGNNSKKVSVTLQQFVSTMHPEWTDDVTSFMEKKLPDLKKEYDEINKEQQTKQRKITRLVIKRDGSKSNIQAIREVLSEMVCSKVRKDVQQKDSPKSKELNAVCDEKCLESMRQTAKLVSLVKEQLELLVRNKQTIKQFGEENERLKMCLLNVTYQMAKKVSDLWLTRDSLKKKEAMVKVLEEEIDRQNTDIQQANRIILDKEAEITAYTSTKGNHLVEVAKQELNDLTTCLFEMARPSYNCSSDVAQKI